MSLASFSRAGDAIFSAWELRTDSNDQDRERAALIACATALELTTLCGTYHIPEVDATLSIHCGLGVSEIFNFRVSTRDRNPAPRSRSTPPGPDAMPIHPEGMGWDGVGWERLGMDGMGRAGLKRMGRDEARCDGLGWLVGLGGV